ncbi:MAG: thiamine diphosphokinase [Clostridiales bacterium]|nr:thiamine diphosphokinase [Clostridiales bacterium]
MKGIVLLGGEPYQGEISTENAFVVACDLGYQDALNRGIVPDLTVGDFDSLGFVPPNAKTYPVEKNATDGEIGVTEIFNRKKDLGITEIEVYNGGGGREDHFLGVLQLIIFALNRDLGLTIYTNCCKIYGRKGSFSAKTVKGRTISLVPFSGEVHIVNSRGLKYPASGVTLRQGETRGISNVALNDEFSLEFTGGPLLVFEVTGERSVYDDCLR